MKIEDFFNQQNIIDLSFFNFSNAITACYYARDNLEILKVNDNFLEFFPILGNVNNVYFPDVLEQIGLPGKQIEEFVRDINENGTVLIPEIKISIDGKERVYSLLSTRTKNDSFTYLNGVQGQFVDRTTEFNLRKERQNLLDEKIRDHEIIEEKSRQLESLAKRLAKYLSPQIYQSIFKNENGGVHKHARKNLTIFLSDIVKFTDLADTLEPERLATVINSYLSEMSLIAVECGGTIDKFIGDAVLIFFGDPESEGETEDALKCAEMAIRMLKRVGELNNHWKKSHFKTNLRRIRDYPELFGYTRDLYQQSGIKQTVNFEHIKQHYYYSHETINPFRIVPVGPELDFEAPHQREERFS